MSRPQIRPLLALLILPLTLACSVHAGATDSASGKLPKDVKPVALGQAATFGNGFKVTVLGVKRNGELPPSKDDPGAPRQGTLIDVELCATTAPMPKALTRQDDFVLVVEAPYKINGKVAGTSLLETHADLNDLGETALTDTGDEIPAGKCKRAFAGFRHHFANQEKEIVGVVYDSSDEQSVNVSFRVRLGWPLSLAKGN